MSTASGSAAAGRSLPGSRPAGGSPTVDRLRELWNAVLEQDDITEGSDFFDLGGNSLTAVELMSKVRAEFKVDLGVVVLFDHPTPGELAAQINRRVR